MKIKLRKKEESGQVLVLLTIGLVALLGLTALAIDGGQIYADRRYDQNVADAAAYAGGGAAAMEMENNSVTQGNFSCTGATMTAVKSAALNLAASRASTNGFELDQDLSDKSGIEVTCGIDTKNGMPDPYVDVQVSVTSKVQTAFAHFFYGGKIENTVESVVRVRPRSNFAAGYAIIALNEGMPDALWIKGSPGVEVNGGGMISNSGIKNGGTNHPTRLIPNSLPIHYITECFQCAHGDFDPDPTKTSVKAVVPEIPAPDCSAVGSESYDEDNPKKSSNEGSNGGGGNPNKDATIQPGNYDRISVTGGQTLTMEPGLYCMHGDLRVTSGTLIANGVTIYMVDGRIWIDGHAHVELSAPTGEAQPAIRNVVIYADNGNNKDIEIAGNSGSYFTGTIYGPKSAIFVSGNGDINPTFHTQIIGDHVTLTGNSITRINFDPDENYLRPTYLELNR